MNKWLRYLEFFRRDPARDIDDEMAMHIELRVADLRAHGLTEADAHDRARHEFGDASAARRAALQIDERVMRREHRTEAFGTLLRDARVAFRSMRRNPGFSVSAILCAAAGIGVATAVVSASYSILVRALPYHDSDRVVAIYSADPERGYTHVNVSYPDFASWRDENRSFSGMGIWSWSMKTLSGDAASGADAERLYGADVSWNLFQTLGVSPMLGRNFLREEDAPGSNHEVIISHKLWQQRFAADSSIVGRTIQLDGRAWTVVGVMPAGFNFPDTGDFWDPFAAGPTEERANRMYAGAIGRLKPGVTLAQAAADMHRVDANLVARFPEDNRGWESQLIPIRDDLVGKLRDPLHVLLGAVALVLLLACINIANLSLARGAARARDLAIRSAIGASRRRLVRQLMTESLLIAVLGGTLGVAIAAGSMRVLAGAFPRGVPFYIHLGIDAPALAFVAAITVATGLLFGVIPALRGSRADLNASLRDGTRGGASSVDRARLRSTLIVGEVALSAMLMTGALLLMRTYHNLQNTSVGFAPQGIVTASVNLPKNAGYPNLADVERFYSRVLERLRANPAVAGAGAAQGIPMVGWNVQGYLVVQGAPPALPGHELDVHYQNVTADYFKTMGVPLLRGRWITAADRDSLNPAVLVNRQLVATAFKGADPIGKRVSMGESGPWGTVVGIIGDFRQYGVTEDAPPAVFWANAAQPRRQMTLVVRVKRGEPADFIPTLRAVIRDIDPRVAPSQIGTMDDVVARSIWQQRLMEKMLVGFAVLALGMACVGLYGVVSYGVSQRWREFGVRMALGATRGSVMRLVLGQGSLLVGIGIAAGLAGAWFAVRMLGSLLYGVHAQDPVTFALVGLFLAGVALVATAIPSRRATRVDPIIAMRAE
jgi:putative ABC transport system permease protein